MKKVVVIPVFLLLSLWIFVHYQVFVVVAQLGYFEVRIEGSSGMIRLTMPLEPSKPWRKAKFKSETIRYWSPTNFALTSSHIGPAPILDSVIGRRMSLPRHLNLSGDPKGLIKSAYLQIPIWAIFLVTLFITTFLARLPVLQTIEKVFRTLNC